MAKANNEAVQTLKSQAKRLAVYLEGIERKVTRGQSLEAMSQALYGRTWHRVQTQLDELQAVPKLTQTSSQTMLVKEVTNHLYTTVDDERNVIELPLSVPVSFDTGAIKLSATIVDYLDDATLEDVLMLCRLREGIPAQQVWFAEECLVDQQLLVSDYALSDLKVWPSKYLQPMLAVYAKAFKPQWYLPVMRAICATTEGLDWDHDEYDVREDADQPGLWLCVQHNEGGDGSYRTKMDAEVALADFLLQQIPTNMFTNVVLRTQVGEGRIEVVRLAAESSRVVGRRCEDTGQVLVLKEGEIPLRVSELERITSEGAFALDVVLPVGFYNLTAGVDAVNDLVSERITGSICGLSDIRYERFQVDDVDKYTSNVADIFIRVVAFVEWDTLEG